MHSYIMIDLSILVKSLKKSDPVDVWCKQLKILNFQQVMKLCNFMYHYENELLP